MYRINPLTDPICLYVRENPGCSRRDVILNATEYNENRYDCSHRPFYDRIKRREDRYGWIRDMSAGHGHPSRLVVTALYEQARKDKVEGI